MEKELRLILAINQCISGYLFKDGDLLAVPSILKDLADDYEKEIQEEADK